MAPFGLEVMVPAAAAQESLMGRHSSGLFPADGPREAAGVDERSRRGSAPKGTQMSSLSL